MGRGGSPSSPLPDPGGPGNDHMVRPPPAGRTHREVVGALGGSKNRTSGSPSTPKCSERGLRAVTWPSIATRLPARRDRFRRSTWPTATWSLRAAPNLFHRRPRTGGRSRGTPTPRCAGNHGVVEDEPLLVATSDRVPTPTSRRKWRSRSRMRADDLLRQSWNNEPGSQAGTFLGLMVLGRPEISRCASAVPVRADRRRSPHDVLATIVGVRHHRRTSSCSTGSRKPRRRLITASARAGRSADRRRDRDRAGTEGEQ